MAFSPFHPPDPLSFQVCSTSLISQPSKTSRNHCLKVERPAFPRSWCQGMEKGVRRRPLPHLPWQRPCGTGSQSPDEQHSHVQKASLPLLCREDVPTRLGGAEKGNALTPLIPPLHLYNRTTSLQKRKPRGKMTHPRSYKIQAAKPGHKSKSDSRLATSPLSDQV